jgi:hypothetical protein
MGQEEHDRDAVARGRALTALVRPYLPVDGLVHGPADAWPLVGPALIARATGRLEAILALVPLGREGDADTLLRSLYERVTTFAWLAGEPGEERMRRWLKSDCEARLRADEDCRKVGVKILDDDGRKWPPDMQGPFGLATIVFALGLYVAAETIAWPRKFEIDRVLTA